jgi:hypothetical protein
MDLITRIGYGLAMAIIGVLIMLAASIIVTIVIPVLAIIIVAFMIFVTVVGLIEGE